MATTKQQLIELQFRDSQGRDLPSWLAEQRTAGLTWRDLERELYRLSDGAISVTHVSLHTWYGEVREHNGDAA